MASFGDLKGLGGEIKLFPPPVYSGESEKWDDWSWQLKSYVSLYKPSAQFMMDRLEGRDEVCTDQHIEDYETTNAPGQALIAFSRQLHYLLAQITDGPARLVVRLNEGGNGFETWRKLYDRFSLPDRARGVSLLSRLLDFKLRDATFEADLTEFISLKNKHEKATGKPLDDDLLVTLMVNKTSGSLQQHLRLNVDALTTFSDVLSITKQYYQSRHLANWRSSSDPNGPAPMDIGAAYWKGKGKSWNSKGKGRNWKGKGKGKFKGKGKKGGSWNWNSKGFSKGKGSSNNKGKGKGKGKIGKGKGKTGDGTGCFICGSHSHWSKDCPHARQAGIFDENSAAATGDYQTEDWSQDWSEYDEGQDDWNWSDWQGAVFDEDWSYWDDSWYDWSDPADWSWSGEDWHWPQQHSSSSHDPASAPSTVKIEEATDSKPHATAAAITSDIVDHSGDCAHEPASSSTSSNPLMDSDHSRRGIGSQRPARPGLIGKLFVGALMLVGTLSSSVPHCPDPEDFVAGIGDCLDKTASSSSSDSDGNIAQGPLDAAIDKLSEFHVQSGIVDKTWILFDSGASANCCPDWFAEDYPLLPVGDDCPSLRSISGKALDILGRRVVELDCNGHSLCVQFYVCNNIPFPLVSVSRFLLQDFWTIMSKNFMALMTPTNRTVPIVRQGTLVYLTPTVIPYSSYSGPKSDVEICALMEDIDIATLQSELRGITDCVEDSQYDHLSKISSLIAAAQRSKRPDQQQKNMDYWEVIESSKLLVRHHVKLRHSMFALNRVHSTLPVDRSRLTGKRVTTMHFSDGTSQIVTDADFTTLKDPTSLTKDWRGKTEFSLTPLQATIAAPKSSGSFKTRFRKKTRPEHIEPEQRIEPSVSVKSRGTESKMVIEDTERSILNRIRSIKDFSHAMKDELVRLFYTPDPLTGQERTTDYWIQLPCYWIRMIHSKRTNLVHPDDEPSPIASSDPTAFGDTLMADRHTCIIESQFPDSNGTEIADYWCNFLTPDCIEQSPDEDPRREIYQAWKGFTVFGLVPIEHEKPVQETIDTTARVGRGLKVPGEPTLAERKQHELTHLPYRDWCPHCVKAKGRHGPSKKQSDRQPVIQIDYCFHATSEELPLRKILSACDVQTGLSMAVVVPQKGENDYAIAEVKKFIYECGRTFGILQYDQESPLKTVCQRVCSELGGLSLRAAPKNHPQSHGSVGQSQRTLYGQLRALLYQVEENTGLKIDSEHALYPWAVKHANWLLNRYLVHSDGHTSYYRRWQKNYDGGLCHFAESVSAKIVGEKSSRKADLPWKQVLWLGRDSEADVATDVGVLKVRTVRRNSPSQQWIPDPIKQLQALPWKPKIAEEQTTEFVLPKGLTITGKIRDPPGLEAPQKSLEEIQPDSTLALEDLPPEGADVSIAEEPRSSGISRPSDSIDDRSSKAPRIDPDTPAKASPTKVQRISAVIHWIGAQVGVSKCTVKDGSEVPIEVNYDSDEYKQELKLTQPIIWDISQEYPEEAQKIGMDKEMDSMKTFGVYTEIPIDKVTQEQYDSAIDLRWVKRWKTESELRMRLVARGCFQDDEKLDTDTLFASTPSLVTLRLMLTLAIARGWFISLADISTAFLHAALLEDVFVFPPKEYYPHGNCLWKLNRAMYGLKQSPQLWQSHFASVMQKLGFRRCKSDSNLYCHPSKELYVLAYVDDLLIIGDEQKTKDFVEQLNKELLVKITGKLEAGSEHSFLGRRLRRNGDSIDILMPSKYIEDLLDMYKMKTANFVGTTGSAAIKRIQDADSPLDKEEHSKYRTAVGKLLWLAFVRPDCSYAVKELSRDVKAPTQESLAKLKHLLRYLSGTRTSVLRLRPNQMLADWKTTIDVVCYVDSDWAGCSKTRKSTSGSTVQALGCNIVHTSRTQGTVALSSGEAELYAIGQGINEALFVRSLILEAEFSRRVNVIVYTDSTAGKSMASRFGTGKRTKHVELRFLYMQNLIANGMLRLCKVHTKENCADLLTKYAAADVLQSLIAKIGLITNMFRL